MNKTRIDIFNYGKKQITIETEFIGTKTINEFFTNQAMKLVNDINNR